MTKSKINPESVGEDPPAGGEPRMPADLQKALTVAPEVVAVWENLTPLARRDFVAWIDSAKQPELSKSRAGQACELLAAGKQRH